LVAAKNPLMAEKTKTPTAPQKRAPTLYFIIVCKLIKGVLSLLLAFGVYKLVGADLSDYFDRFVHWVHLDPESRFLSDLGDRIDQITPANMRLWATGTFLYSLFALVEGVGLIFRIPWAGWLAIGESAFFIPIEIYELVRRPVTDHHHSGVLLIVLILNIFIVWYLLANRKRLFRYHH
jgi:uncharacterized membrane protein (DUF2068 family)